MGKIEGYLMGERFEQYKTRLEKAHSDEVRASKEANDRFYELSDYLSHFNHKGIRDMRFQWHSNGWLELNEKCVGLALSSKDGWRKVWFGEIPSSPNQLNQLPRRIQEWSLHPLVEQDEFKWKVAERGGATFTNDELADEAAIHLTNLVVGRYGQYPEPPGRIQYAAFADETTKS
ncbi:MAG: hypothetical protein C5B58_13485 [Acidobacteria bacterium]|nr:MAG: hypothetical protein C5B58_13485 [Acidobacteriota bacterium]